MNISHRKITDAIVNVGFIVSVLFFTSFLGIASANHGSLSIAGCNTPPANQAAYDNCLAEIGDYCDQQSIASDGAIDSGTCYTSLAGDVRIAAPAQPAAPTSEGGTKGLNNPLAVDSIQGLFEAIMTAFIILCVPFIVFFVILAGFQYVTARGNPEKIKAATQALMYAVIGTVIIVGAIAITTIVGNTVTSFKP